MTTIKDIARLSGYSIGTVSRVINNHADVSETARQKITQIIQETGIKIRLKEFREKQPVFVIGRAVVENEVLIIGPQSFAVFA